MCDPFSDPRKEVEQRGRSVNLALSVRGIESLRAVGAEGPVKQCCISTGQSSLSIFTSKYHFAVCFMLNSMLSFHTCLNCLLKCCHCHELKFIYLILDFKDHKERDKDFPEMKWLTTQSNIKHVILIINLSRGSLKILL